MADGSGATGVDGVGAVGAVGTGTRVVFGTTRTLVPPPCGAHRALVRAASPPRGLGPGVSFAHEKEGERSHSPTRPECADIHLM
ncbi:hypothetical protein Sros01_60280 [Streptomyces roseochromogenus]|nr:hypothetical protein Sros01_60280 [Streptomyces roseochromogenus]